MRLLAAVFISNVNAYLSVLSFIDDEKYVVLSFIDDKKCVILSNKSKLFYTSENGDNIKKQQVQLIQQVQHAACVTSMKVVWVVYVVTVVLNINVLLFV